MTRTPSHVLVVARSPLAERAARLLRDRARSVVSVDSAEAAHRAVAERSYGLVFVELDLDPAALGDLVTSSDFVASAFVVASELARPDQAFKLAQAGVRTFVSLPASDAELLDAARRALEEPPDLAPHVRALVGMLPIHEVERVARRAMLETALRQAQGNKTIAARLLCVSRQLMQHMLRGQKRFA